MKKANNRYKQMERYLTIAILTDTLLFLLFLIYSWSGVLWVRVVTAILNLLISGAVIALLYLNKELLRRRSLWMTTAAISIIACVVFSLLLGYPCPAPV